MQSSRLLEAAMEIFRRPFQCAALSLALLGLSANVSLGQALLTDSYYSAGHASEQGGDDGEAAIVDDGDDIEVPEIADVNGDVAYASGSQSAIPNSIGDSMGSIYYVNLANSYTLNFGGGRRFKAATDNSPIPQDRVIYDFSYFKNGFVNDPIVGGQIGTDVQHHVFGFEKTFWCGMGSVQVQVPVAIDAVNTNAAGLGDNDASFGMIAVALKMVAYQDECSTLSFGVGVDLPTADSMTTFGVNNWQNDAVLFSPYVAYYRDLGCCNFVNSYAQLVLPAGHDEVNNINIDQVTLLYLDVSAGRWLMQDGCGNGVAAIGELHYTTSVDGQQSSVLGQVISEDLNILNATFGVQMVQNCWRITPALVMPLLQNDINNRQFDWEAVLQVNRMF